MKGACGRPRRPGLREGRLLAGPHAALTTVQHQQAIETTGGDTDADVGGSPFRAPSPASTFAMVRAGARAHDVGHHAEGLDRFGIGRVHAA